MRAWTVTRSAPWPTAGIRSPRRCRTAAWARSSLGAASGPGTGWLEAETFGLGGDELPATVLLARNDANGGIVAVTWVAPRVGPGRAWRGRFNLRGTSTLLLEVTAPGPIAVKADGVAVTPSIETLAGMRTPPRLRRSRR